MDEKAKLINDTYINVWKLIKLLSDTNSYAEIGAYFGHINAQTSSLKLYHLNSFYQISEVYLLHGFYQVIKDIIEELIYDMNDPNKEKSEILENIQFKGEKYYWKRSDLTQFQELKDILTSTQIVRVSSIDAKSDVINSEPIEKYLSYWNKNILPEIKKANKISLFDLISLISNKYLKGIKYIGDFIYCYMYISDGFLNNEQEENILSIVESLHNPMNVDKDNPSVHSILKKLSISNDFATKDYELLHVTIFDTNVLSNLFLSQDRDIQYFESTIVFKTMDFQKNKLLQENEKLKEKINTQDIIIKNQNKILEEINEKNSGLEYVNHGLGNSIMWLESEKSDLEMKLKKLEINMSIHPAIDSGNKNYAPELLLAIQAWEAKYINNEYPHQDHTPAIKAILTKKGLTNVRLLDRISAITNPKKK